MDIFLTCFQLLLTSFAAVCAWSAMKQNESAGDARDELASGIRKLNATREELLVLEKRLDRLAGRVYAQGRRPITDEQAAGQIADDIRAAGNGAPVDDDLAALIALQSAPAAKPGS